MAAIDVNAPDKADLEVIRVEVVKSVAKRRQKLEESLKKGYATVYDQCSQEVQDKLKATRDWETVQATQSLDELITRIEKICVGFNDHKQSVFNLVQSLKTKRLMSTRGISGVYGTRWRPSEGRRGSIRDWCKQNSREGD